MKVGILGGGQLGRMLALAGYPLGLTFRFFDPAVDACAGQVGELVHGSYDDLEALKRFADSLDVITYEFENVPVEAATFLEEFAPVYPPPIALEAAQDRLVEKRFFRTLNIPTPEFHAVDSKEDLTAAIAAVGLPAVLKTRREGYDGKGQAVIRDIGGIDVAWNELGNRPLILEEFVPFDRELSVISARNRDEAFRYYPLVENTHTSGILSRTVAPAPDVSEHLQHAAESFAHRVLHGLSYVGVLAIELFELDGQLLANEMAPRVHNSGHWTIEGSETSQFENHLRAIAGLPLGATTMRGQATMLNLIGSELDPESILKIEGAHLHLYGKSARPGRKIGHVTLRGDDPAIVEAGRSAVEELIAGDENDEEADE